MKTKRMITTALIAVTSIAFTISSFAGAATFSGVWTQDQTGLWHANNASGENIRNAWLCDDAITENGKDVWYLLDANGNMVSAGLVQDGTGNFYSLETNHNGYFGMLRHKSGTYECNGQQVYLELEQEHNGSFAAVKNKEAVEALKAIYGLTSVADINNGNIVYTANVTAVKKTAVSGGAGGFGGMGGSGSAGIGGGSSSVSSTVSYSGSSEYENGRWYSLTSSQKQEVNEAIEYFKAKYLKDGMTDFEKEMLIIQWICDTCKYGGKTSEGQTSYNCLIEKQCVCGGYADAFLAVCKACGIECRYLSNTKHAWNLVKIGGKWSHVDVTWEDVGNSGFGKLRNEYINLTDAEIVGAEGPDDSWQARCHTGWTPSSAKGVKNDYSGYIIQYYLVTGIADKNLTLDEWRTYLLDHPKTNAAKYSLYNTGYLFDDRSNYISGNSCDSGAAAGYLNQWFGNGHDQAYLIFDENCDLSPLKEGQKWCDRYLSGNKVSIYVSDSKYQQGNSSFQCVRFTLPAGQSFVTDSSYREAFEKDCKAAGNRMFTDNGSANAYIMECWKQHQEHFFLMYENVARVDYPYWSYGEYSSADRSTRQYMIDGKNYTFVTYDCTYKNLENYMNAASDDGSNCFENGHNSAGMDFVTYVREYLNDWSNRFSENRTNLIFVFPSDDGFDYAGTVEAFLSGSEGAFRRESFSSSEKVYDSRNYVTMQYTVCYIPTVSEFLSENGILPEDGYFETEGDLSGLQEECTAYAASFVNEKGAVTPKGEDIVVPYVFVSRGTKLTESDIRNFLQEISSDLTVRIGREDFRITFHDVSGAGGLRDGSVYEDVSLRIRHEKDPEDQKEKTGTNTYEITFVDCHTGSKVSVLSGEAKVDVWNELSIPEGSAFISASPVNMELNSDCTAFRILCDDAASCKICLTVDCEITVEFTDARSGEILSSEKLTAVSGTSYKVTVPGELCTGSYYYERMLADEKMRGKVITTINSVRDGETYSYELLPHVTYLVTAYDRKDTDRTDPIYSGEHTGIYGGTVSEPRITNYRFVSIENPDDVMDDGTEYVMLYDESDAAVRCTFIQETSSGTRLGKVEVADLHLHDTVDLSVIAPKGYEPDEERNGIAVYTVNDVSDDCSLVIYYKKMDS